MATKDEMTSGAVARLGGVRIRIRIRVRGRAKARARARARARAGSRVGARVRAVARLRRGWRELGAAAASRAAALASLGKG